MALDKPVFTLDKPNTNGQIPDAIWWFMLRLEELEPASQNGGILAYKPSFHAPGSWIKQHYPNHYSIRDSVNKSGTGWSKASAWDWTFPNAQRGDYSTISKYSKRLWHSAHDAADPRLDLWLFEFFGQTDGDTQVEGYNEYREENVSADSSHLWHLHGSVIRQLAGSYWGAWATLTVLMGWSVAKWRASLPASDPNSTASTTPKPVKPTMVKYEYFEAKAPIIPFGHDDRKGVVDANGNKDETWYVRRIQMLLEFTGKDLDGRFGDKTKAGIKAKVKGHSGNQIDMKVRTVLEGLWGAKVTETK